MNVLVTAIGSMSSECVVDSLNKLSIGVVATDIYPYEYHPVAKQCNCFCQVPRVFPDASLYCSILREEALKNGCSAIIPLTDPEVDIISENRDFFIASGIDVWITKDTTIKRVRNKNMWCKVLNESLSFKTIPSYNSYEEMTKVYSGAFVAKRINGRSSEGILFAHTDSFCSNLEYSHGYMFQPLIQGDIITVDFVKHPKSKQIVFIPRLELMRTKNGAGTVVRIVDQSLCKDAITELANQLDITGVMNCEFINSLDGLYLMDINPRFSAGISFSKKAGYDFVKANVDCYCSKSIDELQCSYTGSIFVKRFIDF